MTTTKTQDQNKELQSAIHEAVRNLQHEGGKSFISAPAVRSLVYDIGVTACQPIPETFQLYLPGPSAQFMSQDGLSSLLSHLRDVARAL